MGAIVLLRQSEHRLGKRPAARSSVERGLRPQTGLTEASDRAWGERMIVAGLCEAGRSYLHAGSGLTEASYTRLCDPRPGLAKDIDRAWGERMIVASLCEAGRS